LRRLALKAQETKPDLHASRLGAQERKNAPGPNDEAVVGDSCSPAPKTFVRRDSAHLAILALLPKTGLRPLGRLSNELGAWRPRRHDVALARQQTAPGVLAVQELTAILQHAGKLGFEGVVSKTIDAPCAPGNRGRWRKAKALNRQEFVIVGWSDPEGSRPYLGALLLGYYSNDGKLIYAGRVGTAMPDKVLADLRHRLEPLARKAAPLKVLPPRSTRFGSLLVLSRVHWVEPALVAEITYLTWTADNLLRHAVYVGLREDKPADKVRRER
jgi:hypothetical protein